MQGIRIVSAEDVAALRKRMKETMREAEGLGWMLPPATTTRTTAKTKNKDASPANSGDTDAELKRLTLDQVLTLYHIPKTRVLALGEYTLLFVPPTLFSDMHVVIGTLLPCPTARLLLGTQHLAGKEMELFKQAVTNMYFNSNKSVVVFVERAKSITHGLMHIDCIGLVGSDQSFGDVIPSMLRHALSELPQGNEDDQEECTNARLIQTSLDTIPPNFPYFHCEVRRREGVNHFIHLVNSSTERFKWNTAHDILKAAMDDEALETPQHQPTTTVRDLLLKFQPFDFTLELDG